MVILEFFSRLKFWRTTDRLGPDIAGTHYQIYFNNAGRVLCKKKFKHFGTGAEFRPGVSHSDVQNFIGKNVVISPINFLFCLYLAE